MNKQEAIQNIDFIKQIIVDSKKSFCNDGPIYLVWGLLTSLGMVIIYFNIVLRWEIFYLFIILPIFVVGWIFTYYHLKKERSIVTFSSKLLNTLWFAVGIAITIAIIAVIFSGTLKGILLIPISALILGLAFFVGSNLYGKYWMKLIALLWWLASLIMFINLKPIIILLMAVLLLTLEVVPGYILYREVKDEKMRDE